MEKYYVDTVRLLLATLPEIFAFPKFALKGGTALNLFLHDMPRLSVDIDVVFTDHLKPRTEALKEIAAGLRAAQQQLKSSGIDSELTTAAEGEETKLFVEQNRLAVKVEVNHVFRGTLLPVTTVRLNKNARDLFTTDVSAPVLASAELYGGENCGRFGPPASTRLFRHSADVCRNRAHLHCGRLLHLLPGWT